MTDPTASASAAPGAAWLRGDRIALVVQRQLGRMRLSLHTNPTLRSSLLLTARSI
jgi:hypothetical protein